MLKLVLPYPLSANRYWQSFVPPGARRAIVHLSTEAKQYRREVDQVVADSGIRYPLSGRVEVAILLYPQRPKDYATRMRKFGQAWDDDVRCIDLDNANKVLLDCLKGVVIVDDKWVRSLQSERMEPDALGARAVVYVRQLQLQVVQQSLLEVTE